MANTQRKLLKLVALKRQKAEQALALVQSRLRQLESDLQALQADLARADSGDADVQALMLASRHGHMERMLSEMDRKQADIADAKQQLHRAREDLKKILNSEDQLAQMKTGA